MTFSLTQNFFSNARGLTLTDSATVTWAFNKSTNSITATATGVGGGLTSVGLADTSGTPIYTITNSPLIANGTLDITLNTQTQKTFLAGPTSGAAAQPGFRAIAVADVPTLNQNTSGSSGSCTGNAATATSATSATTATTATNIAGGANGSLPYQTGAGATSLLAAGSTGNLLTIAAGIPAWEAVPTWNQNTSGTAAGLSATLVIGSGGTGQTTAAAAFNALAPMTTTGDMVYDSSAATAARLAIGSTGNVLTVAGGIPSWAAPAAVGANPTGTIGLAAVNGAATTFVRSDGAPALSQAIVPTWSGAHTFSALLTANLGITVAGAPVTLAAGTTTIKPLVFQSGTNLTSAAAGVAEYDGTNQYFTNETSSGRGLVPVEQYFHLAAAGGGITTIANFFGTTSNISLVSGGYYEIEIVAWFTMGSTGSVVTWSLINSAAPTAMNLYYEMCPAGGVVAPPGTAGTMLCGQILGGASATTTVVTASLTLSTKQYARFRIQLKNGTGTSLKIQCAETTTTTALTPNIGSFWRCKRLPAGNTGTFAA